MDNLWLINTNDLLWVVNLTDWFRLNYSKDFERINCTSFIIWFYAKWRRKLFLIQDAAVKPSSIPVQSARFRFLNFKKGHLDGLSRVLYTETRDVTWLTRSMTVRIFIRRKLNKSKMTLIYTRNAFKWLWLTALDCYWFRVKPIDLILNILNAEPNLLLFAPIQLECQF